MPRIRQYRGAVILLALSVAQVFSVNNTTSYIANTKTVIIDRHYSKETNIRDTVHQTLVWMELRLG